MRNDTITDWSKLDGEPVKNGLKCPECGAPLLDVSPNMIYTSLPAQKRTGCTKCKYMGFRRI